MNWVQTRCRVAFDLDNPRPELVELNDVAYALGRIQRFNGHGYGFYSVAEHCVLLARHGDRPRRERLALLLHDAHEAYVGDITRPVLTSVGPEGRAAYDRLCERVDAAILAQLAPELTVEDLRSPAVRAADAAILVDESRGVMGGQVIPWGQWVTGDGLGVVFGRWSDIQAANAWLEAYHTLTGSRG